jgi:hypothetical protein
MATLWTRFQTIALYSSTKKTTMPQATRNFMCPVTISATIVMNENPIDSIKEFKILHLQNQNWYNDAFAKEKLYCHALGRVCGTSARNRS